MLDQYRCRRCVGQLGERNGIAEPPMTSSVCRVARPGKYAEFVYDRAQANSPCILVTTLLMSIKASRNAWLSAIAGPFDPVSGYQVVGEQRT